MLLSGRGLFLTHTAVLSSASPPHLGFVKKIRKQITSTLGLDRRSVLPGHASHSSCWIIKVPKGSQAAPGSMHGAEDLYWGNMALHATEKFDEVQRRIMNMSSRLSSD
ncbi:hypothetical protein Mp_4g01850 [Marchantia polymorpha subsp. ruderalis]|uniref:Uncharacterized protein n=2 Tax=Marchantia polymorpha TaxID=3197 RepID=A0AAF6B5B5_MARPO|nr:hypothetical protein MARPO_0098s0015 [Marchantia polymorpha]BBN07199.1 hypothetical protein Mp_4g01850 [Marchantia polymorpha subsp. ruderalis]|eukprot:PTQ32460.1 hypothetical protein MARPO_0098s0015 [Marchantia polymorpha]